MNGVGFVAVNIQNLIMLFLIHLDVQDCNLVCLKNK